MNVLANFVAGWLGLLCPPGRTSAPIPQGLARAIHLVVWLSLLAWLWHEGSHPVWSALIDAPWPGLQRWWLPMAGTLAYVIMWLIRSLWTAALPTAHVADGSDLERSWRDGLAELARAGLDIKQTPLFLMLGATPSEEQTLMEAAPWSWTVTFTPAECPFHCYANPQAMLVSCPGASSLTSQACMRPTESGAPPSTDQLRQMQEILSQALEQGRGPDQLTVREKRCLRRLADASKTDAAVPSRQEDATLRELGELIRRSRGPFCSINGLLMTVPWDALTPGEDLAAFANATRYALAEVQAGLQIECPMVILITGLEAANGFSVWAKGLTATRRREVLGQAFPLMPDLDPTEVLACWRQGLGHFADRGLAELIFPALDAPPTIRDQDQIWSSNEPLLRFWDEVRGRVQALANLLPRWMPADPQTPLLLAGCWLAATGAGHSAFAAGVFHELLDKQDHVARVPEMPAAA